MNKRRGGLGSGLDALLPSASPGAGTREVPIGTIQQNPRQPRTHFDDAALEELATSIREHGIIQPLIVSERGLNRYELVAGERRWRAAQRAGLDRVPVIVRETSQQQLLELALIENVQRADLNPIEEAHAYEALKRDFGMSDSDIARRLGKGSREAVVNTRRLLNLAPGAQEALLRQEISAGHGRALLKLKDTEQQQQALEAIIADDWTVREAERFGELVNNLGDVSQALAAIRAQRRGSNQADERPKRAGVTRAPARTGTISPEEQELKREMEQILGTPVHLTRTDNDLRVTIVFHTDEKVQEFFDLLNAAQSG
ncbi:MAG TPA: ParB/RepB/Spo0J family partition protein [Roseiflexaceae bacterium]|nr:ParB/RepB/Spo0J family partition protein [Roseiflexaceae bacterium]